MAVAYALSNTLSAGVWGSAA